MLGSLRRTVTWCNPMISRLRLLLPLLAVLALSACGESEQSTEGERASASTDSSTLLRATFGNLDKMKSAEVDLKLNIEPRGVSATQGPVSARLHGPFASQGPDKLPKFAFTAELAAGGQTFNAGATWTGTKAYISLMGTPYAVSDLVMKQFVATYEQSLKSNKSKGSGGLVLGSLGIDFTKWLPDARNEGAAKVGDADTIKISGKADIKQVVADLDRITAKASTLNVPGAGGRIPQKLTPEQKQASTDAIKSLTVTVYTGAEDKILRRLTVNADLNAADAKVDAAVLLDVTFTKVAQEQTFPVPDNPKPFGELLKAVDAAGLADLGLGLGGGGSDSTAPDSSSVTPNNVDKYADCIEQAKGDTAKARKCAELLSS
jgi:hypothetical protein